MSTVQFVKTEAVLLCVLLVLGALTWLDKRG